MRGKEIGTGLRVYPGATVCIQGLVLPSNDTSTSPHKSYSSIIEFPVKFFCRLSHQHKSLCIRYNLRGIQSLQIQIIGHNSLP